MSKRITAFAALCGLSLLSLPALAAPVAFPLVLTDSSGNRVPGATLVANGTPLTAGTAGSVTAYNLATDAAVSGVSVTYRDFGNGFYTFSVDPTAAGSDLYIPLMVSKSGSTFANSGVVDLTCTVDPQSVQTAASQATTAASQATTAASQATTAASQATTAASQTTPTNQQSADAAALTAYGAATPAADATAVWGAATSAPTWYVAPATPLTAAQIAAGVWSYTIDPLGPLTAQDALSDLWDATSGQSGTITYTSTSQTTPYLRADNTTVAYTSTLALNTAGKATSRTRTNGTRP